MESPGIIHKGTREKYFGASPRWIERRAVWEKSTVSIQHATPVEAARQTIGNSVLLWEEDYPVQTSRLFFARRRKIRTESDNWFGIRAHLFERVAVLRVFSTKEYVLPAVLITITMIENVELRHYNTCDLLHFYGSRTFYTKYLFVQRIKPFSSICERGDNTLNL